MSDARGFGASTLAPSLVVGDTTLADDFAVVAAAGAAVGAVVAAAADVDGVASPASVP